MTPEAFTSWLEKMRLERKWLQRDCAKALELTPSEVSRYKTKGTSPHTDLAIYYVTDKPPDLVLAGDRRGRPKPKQGTK